MRTAQIENECKWPVSTDFTKPFSINGLEFDLAELEQYENRLTSTSTAPHGRPTDSVDDLDEYLERMALSGAAHVERTENTATESKATEAQPSTSAARNAHDPIECKASTHTAKPSDANIGLANDANLARTSFPLLLFGLLSILAFVNSVQCKRKQFQNILCSSMTDVIWVPRAPDILNKPLIFLLILFVFRSHCLTKSHFIRFVA